MNTPVYDFVHKYAGQDVSRFHMPGHKGKSFLGCEAFDITEIEGADVLYGCNGIIKESEDNLSSLFGTAHSYYSTEGSSLCIKAMLALALQGKEDPLVLAARNVHKAFCYAAALLDFEVEFIYSKASHLCSCEINAEDVKNAIENSKKKPCALYLTSPDYLGYIPDIKAISNVCKEYKIPLLVDNAHGAYLNFLPRSLHPIELGATLCCDSAHKTLPVLTGGAYLHISMNAPKIYTENARSMLSLFASTSPSYLILQSLDLGNRYISEGYRDRLLKTVNDISVIKEKLMSEGFFVKTSEPLKIVFENENATELCIHFRNNGIEAEFCDKDTLVLMASTENNKSDYERLLYAAKSYKGSKKRALKEKEFSFKAQRAVSIRKAMFCEAQTISIEDALGRICACPTVSCPPAVPVVVSGEIITDKSIEIFKEYGIKKISVIK
ncbi:MAG: aminotransferase class I/II-fold pyridoxal phosphate-dependent enzyme [Clostridia bacterium]|nr:aminotransferase class I/II-fold pyridoxal phosphate-dependent enzyme [Clostridia bacterium]